MLWMERKYLTEFCRQYGLDLQEIDDSLTYYENKKHLMSMVEQPDDSKMAMYDSALAEYMEKNFLTYYWYCMQEGKTVSVEVGEADTSKPIFDLRTMCLKPFSLSEYCKTLNLKPNSPLTIPGRVKVGDK